MFLQNILVNKSKYALFMLVLLNLHALCSTKIFTQQNSEGRCFCENVYKQSKQVIFEAINTSKREELAQQPINRCHCSSSPCCLPLSCIGVSNAGQIGLRCAVLVASLSTSQTCDRKHRNCVRLANVSPTNVNWCFPNR